MPAWQLLQAFDAWMDLPKRAASTKRDMVVPFGPSLAASLSPWQSRQLSFASCLAGAASRDAVARQREAIRARASIPARREAAARLARAVEVRVMGVPDE